VGDENAGRFYVRLFVDGKFIEEKSFSDLESKSSGSCSFTWKAVPGIHEIRCIVVPEDDISESNDDNNYLVITIVVEEQGTATSSPDLLAKQYAPLFLVEAGSAPHSMYYTYTWDEEKGLYVIKYLQVYSSQPAVLKPHFINDFSLVYIEFDENGKPLRILYDGGLFDCIRLHCTASRKWIWGENRPILIITDYYHHMKIDESLANEEYYVAMLHQTVNLQPRKLTTDTLMRFYLMPDIGRYGYYMTGLGWDITADLDVTEGTDSIKLDVEAELKGGLVNIRIKTEQGAKVSIWFSLGRENELRIIKYAEVISVPSGIYEASNIDLEGFEDATPVFAECREEVKGMYIWVTACKIDENGVKRSVVKKIVLAAREITASTEQFQGIKVSIVANPSQPDWELAQELKILADENKLRPIKGIKEKVIILVGGPLANSWVKKYSFSVEVTTSYPGKYKGVIETINNPYGEGKVILLAGSDRWGTKAAVKIFEKLDYLPTEPIFVDWNDGAPNVILQP